MATNSATTSKTICIICSKTNGIFTCRGCEKDFCLRHANEHRQVLSKKLDEEVIMLHDHLKESFREQSTTLKDLPSMKKIDKWEQESIQKIHQLAEEARKQLAIVMDNHLVQINKSLGELTEELKVAREEENFFEYDIDIWTKRLDDIKIQAVTTPDINLRLENISIDLDKIFSVRNIDDLTEDWFDRAYGAITISDDNKLVTHNATGNYASIRGRCDYETGKHRLRFQLEHIDDNRWFFIGIIAKSTTSSGLGSIGANTYGFSGQSNVWRNGSHVSGFNGYRSDFETNDIINLLIDCDQRSIQLTNERTAAVHSLEIDLNACAFPWKLTVGLYYTSGERIRLLKR